MKHFPSCAHFVRQQLKIIDFPSCAHFVRQQPSCQFDGRVEEARLEAGKASG